MMTILLSALICVNLRLTTLNVRSNPGDVG